MKSIRVAFADWYDSDYQQNFIIDALKERYLVEVIDIEKEVAAKKSVQYLFYSCFGNRHLEFDCVRIFYTGENRVPDFNLCDYGIGFDHIEYGDRYFRYPLYMTSIYGKDMEGAIKKHIGIDESYAKRKFCCMVVSNKDYADPVRKEIFESVCRYKTVDSGGRYLNNINMPEGVEDKYEFQRQYKFSLALENSSHEGYITEKLLQGFSAKTVPIYWGDPEKESIFNSKAYLYANDYQDQEDLIRQIRLLDNDEHQYLNMLKEPAIDISRLNATKESFKVWLYHIFDQDLENACRRSRYGNSQVHEKELRKAFENERQSKSKNKHTIWEIIGHLTGR